MEDSAFPSRNKNFYLVLLNQSNDALEATVTLNADVAPYDAQRSYDVQVWQENEPAPATRLQNGKVTAPEDGLAEARLRYRHDGEENELVESSYPFEFTVPGTTESSFTFSIEGLTPEGERIQSEELQLIP